MLNMKKIYLLPFAIFFAIAFSACRENLLDTAPYDSISSGNVWTTENLAQQAVTGMYNVFLQGDDDNQDLSAANYMGKDAFIFSCYEPSISARSNWNSTFALLSGSATPSSGEFANCWKQHYEGISRANDVIANIENVEAMDTDLRARYLAEAKFLRAYFYYRLNSLYRGVPLYLEPTELEDYTKARSTEAEVWSSIISDLTDCINEPNLPDKYAQGDDDYGHVTKGAAYALRGKTYLWTGEYAKAADDFKKVTTMGYNLFQGDYMQMFKETNEQCDEMIFSIQCTELDNYGNRMSLHYGSRTTRGGCWDDYFGSPDFMDTYECIDGKPFDWEDFIPGYKAMTPNERSVYFFRNNMDDGQKTKMKNYGSDLSKYLPSGNEERIKTVYERRDPRMMQTFITPYSTYLGSPSGVEHNYTLRWPYIGYDAKEPYDVRTDSNTKFCYLIRKFVSEGNELPYRQYSPIDVPLIRFADVLLSLAEALNEQGKTDEAIPYINLVRERVGIAPLNSNQYTQVAGQDDLRQRIQNEKRWELAGEGVEYFDELRWGTWFESKMFSGAGLKECWGTSIVNWLSVGDYSTVWPIPTTEIQKNPNLTQNPGWVD